MTPPPNSTALVLTGSSNAVKCFHTDQQKLTIVYTGNRQSTSNTLHQRARTRVTGVDFVLISAASRSTRHDFNMSYCHSCFVCFDVTLSNFKPWKERTGTRGASESRKVGIQTLVVEESNVLEFRVSVVLPDITVRWVYRGASATLKVGVRSLVVDLLIGLVCAL